MLYLLLVPSPGLHYNDYMMAKRRKAFRRAASRLSAAALLLRHIIIAMSIARMILESFVAKLVVW